MNTHSPIVYGIVSTLAILALILTTASFLFTTLVPQARAASLAEQIICYVDQELGPDVPFDPQTDYCGSGEPLPMLCADGIDNDSDGLVDLNDPGCSSSTDNTESPNPALMQCADSIDNDQDGVTDLADPDCDSSTDNTESGTMGTSTGTTTVQCNDTIDNDGDSLIDLNDPGCSNAQDNNETNSGGNGTSTPTLTLVKHAMGGNGTFSFTLNGAGTTTLTTTNGWATSSAIALALGSTTIAEVQSNNWNTTGISCSEGGQSFGMSAGMGAYTVSAANGDNIICTFHNTATSSDAALHVDSIDAVKTSAIANDTYEDGWRYVFHITTPNSEENLSMRFSDWIGANASNTIAVGGNMRVSSAQASSTSPVTLTGSNIYSTPPFVMMTDLNPSMPGRQVEVVVEVKIPAGTQNDTYTTTYGVQTLP